MKFLASPPAYESGNLKPSSVCYSSQWGGPGGGVKSFLRTTSGSKKKLRSNVVERRNLGSGKTLDIFFSPTNARALLFANASSFSQTLSGSISPIFSRQHNEKNHLIEKIRYTKYIVWEKPKAFEP